MLSDPARNGRPKLPGFDAGVIGTRRGGDLIDVIWLVLMWLGLIALWGASEAWTVAALRHRVSRLLRFLRPRHRAHPFDWAQRGRSGPRPTGGRW